MALIALISDIHANLEALQAVLRDVAGVTPDKIICLGDVVGYGPDPGPCVELIHARRLVTILGNHDEAAVTTRRSGDFNEAAMQGMEFTRDNLTEAQKKIMRDWPRRLQIVGVEFTHASFGRRRYEYVATPESAAEALAGMTGRLGAVGHTHIPSAFSVPLDKTPEDEVELLQLHAGLTLTMAQTHRCIVNPGSVGQPRDRNPDASWGLLDTKASTFEIFRVPYDIDAVVAKMSKAGLPEFLGERLRNGA